ncbi:hypothetical protein A2U01_0104182, partial [Trifolium medium]|nr:hypothetical protein [Trifolium medium]
TKVGDHNARNHEAVGMLHQGRGKQRRKEKQRFKGKTSRS